MVIFDHHLKKRFGSARVEVAHCHTFLRRRKMLG
jgi:hypothetical protein